MALVFGSPAANLVLEKNREIQRKLASAQEDYDRWSDRLGEVEGEIGELEQEQEYLERKINELLQLAEEHGVKIVQE